MVIDANVYWFPEAMFTDEALLSRFIADAPRGYGTRIIVKENQGRKQIVVERPAGCPGVDYVQGDYIMENVMAALRTAGIDHAVLKVPCVNEWMSLDMCRYFNDGMADWAKRSGGFFTALAIIPPWGESAALEELSRCRNELGMKAVQLSAHYGELYLDDPAFAPMFEKLEELGMNAYVHHTPVPVQFDSLKDYNNLRRSYGRCVDQMQAVSRELFSGMFERYPHVKLVHSMLGGGFFTYKDMLMPHGPKGPDIAGRFSATPDSMRRHLENNLYFEMSHAQPWGTVNLGAAVQILGADHIVYGSSYPVKEEWMTGGAEFVRRLGLRETDARKILGENARMLYMKASDNHL